MFSKTRFKSAILAGVLLAASLASATIIQGEWASGAYPNVAVDALGRLLTVSTGTQTVAGGTGTFTDRSGTITIANTSQQVVPANLARKYLMIQNTGDVSLWCNETSAATASQPSFILPTGSVFVMEGMAISTGAFNCIGATAGKAYTAKEM